MRLTPILLSLTLLFGCGKSEPEKTAEAPVVEPPVAAVAPPAQVPAAAAPVEQPVAGVPAAAPVVDKGRLKYVGVCQGCHGRAGEGMGPFPKLTGKPAAEVAAMLKDYRAGKTRGPQTATMMPFAKALSDEEIDAISNYLANL